VVDFLCNRFEGRLVSVDGLLLEVFGEVDLNISRFEVVSVDLNLAGDGSILSVDPPGRLPLSAPEGSEVKVDARDVNL
jgi:hypothetical protein